MSCECESVSLGIPLLNHLSRLSESCFLVDLLTDMDPEQGHPPPQPDRYLVDLFDRRIGAWKFLMALLAIAISLALPFFVGFVNEFSLSWQVPDLVTTALIAADFVVIANTPFVDAMTDSLVVDRAEIVKNYGIWGLLDFISIFPYTFAIMVFPTQVWAKFWILTRLVHVRKMAGLSSLRDIQHRGLKTLLKWVTLIFGKRKDDFRLGDHRNAFDNVSTVVTRTACSEELLRMTSPEFIMCTATPKKVTFLSIHLVGCLFYLMATINPNVKKSWLSLVEEQADKETHHALFIYVLSLYWATTVFSTVGYGDLHPVNGLEMFFNTVSILANMGFSGYVMKKLNDLLFSNDHRATMNVANIKALKSLVWFQNLPPDFRQEMCDHIIQLQDSAITSSNLLTLFPKDLQRKYKENAFSQFIRNVYFFHGVSPTLVFQLVSEMEVETVETGRLLVQENEYPDKFYILVHGGMERVGQPLPIQICGELGVFGGLPQPFSVRTTTRAILLTLNKIRFEQLLQVNKNDADIIASNVIRILTQQQQQQFLHQIET
ncbi:hypothetical protein KSS87_001285, partial [Heliosperma pusillum]